MTFKDSPGEFVLPISSSSHEQASRCLTERFRITKFRQKIPFLLVLDWSQGSLGKQRLHLVWPQLHSSSSLWQLCNSQSRNSALEPSQLLSSPLEPSQFLSSRLDTAQVSPEWDSLSSHQAGADPGVPHSLSCFSWSSTAKEEAGEDEML